MADKLPAGVTDDDGLPPGVYEQGKTWAERAVSAVAKPLTSALAKGLEIVGDTGLSPYSLREPSQAIAQAIVPQTPLQVGSMAGTMGMGGLAANAGLRPLVSAGLRVLGGAAGGAGGGALGEEGPVTGAMIGGGGAAAGEAIGLIGRVAGRALPGAKERIAKSSLDEFAEEVGVYLPSLRGMTPDQVKKAAISGKGFKAEIDARYGMKLADVEAQIGGHQITVPSLGPKPMSLTEAVEQLKKIGHAGFGGGKDLNPTIYGKDMRVDWKTVVGEIESELNRINPSGEAAAAFLAGRQEWAVGKSLIDLFKTPGVLKGIPDGVTVNFNQLRAGFERTYRRFERSMLPDELAEVERIIYRGGPFGSRDFLGPTSGVGDAAARIYRQGGGTGTAALVGPRTLLPGLGDQYTGKAPYTLPAAGQMGIDILMQGLGGNVAPQP